MSSIQRNLILCIISIVCIAILMQNYYVRKRLNKFESYLHNINEELNNEISKELKEFSSNISNAHNEISKELKEFSSNISNAHNEISKELKELSSNISNAHNEISKELKELSSNIQNSQQQTLLENIKLNSEALLKAAMAEKVEAIVKNKITTEEKVIAIAQWVSSHISNDREFGNKVYTWFAGRLGLCSVRSSIFVEMLKYINVYSAVYNICEFPTCKTGHSNAQVYYDDSWHYFDVTYAGYFKKVDKILSFEEIVEISKKEDPLKYLIVFKETLDRSKTYYNDFYTEEEIIKMKKVDNTQRMRMVYNRDNIRNASNYGPYIPGGSFDCSKYCKNIK